jgi:hypothetical protein
MVSMSGALTTVAASPSRGSMPAVVSDCQHSRGESANANLGMPLALGQVECQSSPANQARTIAPCWSNPGGGMSLAGSWSKKRIGLPT